MLRQTVVRLWERCRAIIYSPVRGPRAMETSGGPALTFELVTQLLLERFAARGLELAHQDPVNRRAFGNTYADFLAPAFRLRLVQDRGQLLLALAPLSEDEGHWYPVSYILEFLGKLPFDPQTGLIDPRDAVNALDGAWSEVAGFLRRFREGRPALDDYLRQRFEERMRAPLPRL